MTRSNAGAQRLGAIGLAFLFSVWTTASWAGPAEDAATRAYETHQEHCASLASGDVSGKAKATVEVSPVWVDVDAAYNQTGAPYLLYWRAILGQCLNQPEAAIEDFQYFLGSQEGQSTFTTLVKDAKARLRRMGAPIKGVPPPPVEGATGEYGADAGQVASDERRRPMLLIGAGGGYQRTGDWNYAALAADVSIRLHKFLRIEVILRPAIGEPAKAVDGGTLDGETVRPILTTFGVGPHLRFLTAGPLRPFAGVYLQMAANPSERLAPGAEGKPFPFLLGVAGGGGLDISLGKKVPLSVGPVVEVGFMVPHFTLRGMFQVRLALF